MPSTVNRLRCQILRELAESLLSMAEVTGQDEVNDLARWLAGKRPYRPALAKLGAAARKAFRNCSRTSDRRELTQREFMQELESSELKKLLEVSGYLRRVVQEGLEGDNFKFLTMVSQLALLGSN